MHRWEIELIFKQFKSDICNNKTSVQNDFSVLGSEFINFISTLVSCRIRRGVQDAGLLKNMLYGDLIEDLNGAWRLTESQNEVKSNDNYWIHTMLTPFAELKALWLSEPTPKPEPKRKGRPKKESTDSISKRP